MTHEKIKGLEMITLELKAWTEITANKKVFPPTCKNKLHFANIWGGVDMGSGHEHLII